MPALTTIRKRRSTHLLVTLVSRDPVFWALQGTLIATCVRSSFRHMALLYVYTLIVGRTSRRLRCGCARFVIRLDAELLLTPVLKLRQPPRVTVLLIGDVAANGATGAIAAVAAVTAVATIASIVATRQRHQWVHIHVVRPLAPL